MNRIGNQSGVRVVLLGHVDLSRPRPAAHEPEQNAWRIGQYAARLKALVAKAADPEKADLEVARRVVRGELRLTELRDLWEKRAKVGSSTSNVRTLGARGVRAVRS